MKPNQLLLLAGLFLSSVILSSCDKDNVLPATGTPSTGTPPANPTTPPTTPATPPPTSTPPPVTTNSLLKQLGVQVFKYDAQNRLIEMTYTNQDYLGYTIDYEGNRPIRLNFKGGMNYYLIYTYTGDKVTSATNYSPNGQVKGTHTFEYSGEKLVKKTSISYTPHEEGRLHVTNYKYDENGNLTQLIQAWSSSARAEDLSQPSVILWGDYDKYPNPKPFADSGLYLPGVKLFQNNPGFRDAEIYTYTYHESGMPKQRYAKLKTHPHMQPVVYSYTY